MTLGILAQKSNSTEFFPSGISCPNNVLEFLVKCWSKNGVGLLDNILRESDVLVEKNGDCISGVRTFSIDTKVLGLVVVDPDLRKKGIASKLTDMAIQKIREKYQGILRIDSVASTRNGNIALLSAQKRLPPDTILVIDSDK